MFDTVPFTIQEGNFGGHDITVFALSTCGFWKRALAYLKERNVAFRYVYMDLLPEDKKQEVKDTLRKTFRNSLLYPYLIVDGTEVITGFVKEKWDELLGLQA